MDIKIDASWFRFLADLPSDEIKKVVRAIWDYTHGNKVEKIDSAAWETIKASIDYEIQRKKEISEKRRAAILARWHKNNQSIDPQSEPEPQIQKEIIEPEIIKPKNIFISLTDDLTIRTQLENPDSAISVFLDSGSRYDELSMSERDFVDRPDVRSLCGWHKEIQAETKRIKRKKFVPPTIDEWLDFCRDKNLDLGKMRNAYESYVVADWHDSQGNPIRNWKQKILQVWAAKPQNYNHQTANFGKQSEMEKFAKGAKMAEQMLKQQGII